MEWYRGGEHLSFSTVVRRNAMHLPNISTTYAIHAMIQKEAPAKGRALWKNSES
jgi:hypothetical protein